MKILFQLVLSMAIGLLFVYGVSLSNGWCLLLAAILLLLASPYSFLFGGVRNYDNRLQSDMAWHVKATHHLNKFNSILFSIVFFVLGIILILFDKNLLLELVSLSRS